MDKGKQIRVLHVLGGVGLGGAESRIMDLYRQMNRDEIQFDFLVHSSAVKKGFLTVFQDGSCFRKPQFYDEEIKALGGRIYALPKFKIYNYFSYKKAVTAFFAQHHAFQVVQGHMTSTAAIYLPIAKRFGIPTTVAHARNAGVVKGPKGIATRFFRRGLAKKADVLFACSKLAGEDVFGTDAMKQGEVKIIHNAIDAKRFAFDEKKGRRRGMLWGSRINWCLVMWAGLTIKKTIPTCWRSLRRSAKSGPMPRCFFWETAERVRPWRNAVGSLGLRSA